MVGAGVNVVLDDTVAKAVVTRVDVGTRATDSYPCLVWQLEYRVEVDKPSEELLEYRVELDTAIAQLAKLRSKSTEECMMNNENPIEN